jgi:hypothetical protein
VQNLFFTVKQWNKFSWNMQEVLCKKYNVILIDYQTRKEKIISLLNKINIKNFNKGMDTFNKSLNKFSKAVDSLTASASKSSFTGFDQGKSTEAQDKAGFSSDAIWGKPREDTHLSIWCKPVRLTGSPVSIWPEKQSQSKDQKTDTGIW